MSILQGAVDHLIELDHRDSSSQSLVLANSRNEGRYIPPILQLNSIQHSGLGSLLSCVPQYSEKPYFACCRSNQVTL